MSKIKLITVASHPEHAQVLIKSSQKHNWELILIQAEWRGFGTKIIETYNYLKQHPEIERFVFADAYDVCVMGTEEEFEETLLPFNMMLSAEKGLWPPSMQPFKAVYTDSGSPFNYPNSGCYYAKSEYFISLYEKYPPFYEIDDQFWMHMCYMLEPDDIELDFEQYNFNSHSHISEGEYRYENNRIQIGENEPIFIHSNGRSVDPKLDELINKILA